MIEPDELFERYFTNTEAQSHYEDHDAKRDEIKTQELQPLIDEFLDANIDVEEFKVRIDGINKRNELWGFDGFNGQMHFNQLVLSSPDKTSLAEDLRNAIGTPISVNDASQKIDDFAELARQYRENNLESQPRIKPTLYFLSYFWHIQNHEKWPIFYYTAETYLKEVDLFDEGPSYGADYVNFVETYDELCEIAQQITEIEVQYRDISNAIYWYTEESGEDENDSESDSAITHPSTNLTDPYLPPVIADIVEVANNSDESRSQYGVEDAGLAAIFEDKVGHAFRMLGFDTEELGQGAGREPDGIAVAVRNDYAVLYDAKMRRDGYRIGRDDRAIREYITAHTRKLRDKGHKNIYFVIISSSFPNPDEGTLQDLITNTDIDNVILLRAGILADLVKIRLNEPYLNLNDVQSVFSNRSGLIHQEELQTIIPEWRQVTLDNLI